MSRTPLSLSLGPLVTRNGVKVEATSLPAEAVAALVGGLTGQLKALEV
jgi:hypothetical protein